MPSRAFLICSDDKALDAVTQILVELDVSFEHFHEPTSAVRRLGTQHYDAILVDCDDVPKATAVLNAVRSSNVNQNSMTIAIVDGKAGVPTAFRLGAKLVMTKPVSLDQARNTLRNALALKKKEHDGKALAAAANTSAISAPAISTPTAPAKPVATPVSATRIQKAEIASLDFEMTSAPLERLVSPAKSGASSAAGSPKLHLAESRTKAGAEKILPKPAPAPSDEAAELEELENISVGSSPSFGMIGESKRGKKKKNTPLIAVLVLGIAGAATYAAFILVPAFHDMALAQYLQIKTMVGLDTAPAAQPVAVPVKSASAAFPTTGAPSDGFADSTANPSVPNSTATDGFAAAPSSPATSTPAAQSNPAAAKTPTPTLIQASAPAQKSSSELISVPSDVSDAHVSYRVKPEYPEKLRRKNVQGSVVLQATVKADGSVDSVQVVSGNPQLSAAAAEAVKQWRYEPYYRNRQTTPFQTQVTIDFGSDKSR